jgi:hypothetical protein
VVDLPDDVTYPLWGWDEEHASELTGVEVTRTQLTRAHRELEKALARRVGGTAWWATWESWHDSYGLLAPWHAGYGRRRGWVEAVSWQAAWRTTQRAAPNGADQVQLTSERLGDHTQTYAHPVTVGGTAVAAEAHRALAAAGLLADRLGGVSR